MTMKTLKMTVAAMVAAVGLAASAQASELVAYRGQSIDLGSVSGVAYCTVEKSGYRIVATLADADGKAVRFEAVLAPGQTMVLSSPSARGEAPVRIEICRQGDRVEVLKSPVTT
jgi:predicted aconitase